MAPLATVCSLPKKGFERADFLLIQHIWPHQTLLAHLFTWLSMCLSLIASLHGSGSWGRNWLRSHSSIEQSGVKTFTASHQLPSVVSLIFRLKFASRVVLYWYLLWLFFLRVLITSGLLLCLVYAQEFLACTFILSFTSHLNSGACCLFLFFFHSLWLLLWGRRLWDAVAYGL